ncbi:glutathione S-transferase 2-like [Gymnogyps californianus]|uniref:glutathione S-transferase 2-like n=1 Tax=Gymnogyps californianus TaxID=33616 RepID=UPI0021C98CDF|nr:glutathione S-transferase 2-like [Gymnogyps californianus]
MVVTLGYWDIRGLAHPIRLLLEYTETPYQERQYRPGPAPDFSPSDWTSEKEKLGLDFPNLPYLIDGPTKLTQSNAILRYIARKHNMGGETEEEMLRVDMLENQIMDFRMSFARLCYNPDFEKLKPAYLEQLPGKLRELSRFLGSRPWFAGEKLTFVDFVAYDVLDQHRMFVPECPELQGNLGRFLQRFEALEKISAYMQSGRFMKTPIFWRTAQWCNTKDSPTPSACSWSTPRHPMRTSSTAAGKLPTMTRVNGSMRRRSWGWTSPTSLTSLMAPPN